MKQEQAQALDEALEEALELEERTTYQRVFVAGWNAGEAEARSGALARPAFRPVLELAEQYRDRWRTKDEAYWLARLMQEVGELASATVGDHEDPPEHELRQIASICLNWLDRFYV